MKTILAVIFLCLISFAAAGELPGGSDENGIPLMNKKNGYIAPFKIFDNVYYVGDQWVSAYVIKTSEGLILIDTLEGGFGPWISQGVKSLGLNPADIKYVFVTHGHSDHVGGARYIQSQYGSKVVMTSADYALALTQASNSLPPRQFKSPRKNIVAEDADTLTLGDTTITMYITPGHTRGCLSLEFLAKNGEDSHRAFIIGGMGTNFSGIDSAQSYLDSIARIRAITIDTPVEVNLTNHPHMSQLFERRDRLSTSNTGHSFVDPKSFKALLDLLEQRGVEKLSKEKQAQH